VLAYCTHCGHRVSTTALRCPACGTPPYRARISVQSQRVAEAVSLESSGRKPFSNAVAEARTAQNLKPSPLWVANSKPQVDVRTAANYELALLSIPLAASLLAWFWIGGMSLLEGPASSLGLLAALTVLSTAGIAAVEVTKDKPESSPGLGPVGWFFGMTLLWVIVYPLYLKRRRLFGLKDRSLLGILVVLLFACTVVLLALGIESATNSLQQSFQ
jgi:zinc-ribbon domain